LSRDISFSGKENKTPVLITKIKNKADLPVLKFLQALSRSVAGKSHRAIDLQALLSMFLRASRRHSALQKALVFYLN